MRDIDIHLVLQLIAEQLPQWKDLPIRPVENSGWDNRMFRLGEDKVIRLPSSKQYEPQIEKENHFLPLFSSILPCQIPKPIFLGQASEIYPLKWAIYQWIEGEILACTKSIDLTLLAEDLAKFVTSLHQIQIQDVVLPSKDNFYRGGNLRIYDDEARGAINLLRDKIDYEKAMGIWNRSLATKWHKAPVWIHGDISAGNIIIRDGKLFAMIDFGMIAMGDPACDIASVFTLFEKDNRNRFLNMACFDKDTIDRAKGWALWKAAIISSGLTKSNQIEESISDKVLSEILCSKL